MNSDAFGSKLDQFLSGELTDRERSDIEGHLQTCESCRTELAALRQWKGLIQRAGKPFTANAEFRKDLEEEYGWKKASERRLPTWAGALVASAVLAAIILIALSYRVTLARKQVFGEIVDQHSAILSAGRSLDVNASDHETVEGWFRGKVPFTLHIPQLANTPFSLLGARLVFLNQIAGAQLVFTSRGRQVSAFVFLEDQLLRRSLQEHDIVTRQAPFNVEICGKRGLRYLIVGEVDSETVHQLADLMEGSESTPAVAPATNLRSEQTEQRAFARARGFSTLASTESSEKHRIWE
jgi:anti-sigma factor RsiW